MEGEDTLHQIINTHPPSFLYINMREYLMKECPESLIQNAKAMAEVSISLNQIYNHCVVLFQTLF